MNPTKISLGFKKLAPFYILLLWVANASMHKIAYLLKIVKSSLTPTLLSIKFGQKKATSVAFFVYMTMENSSIIAFVL